MWTLSNLETSFKRVMWTRNQGKVGKVEKVGVETEETGARKTGELHFIYFEMEMP